MSLPINIREARRDDVEGLAELYALSGWRLGREHAFKLIEFSMSSDYSKVLVADLSGKVISKVTLDTVFPPYAEIVNVLVHPNYREMGVGSGLVKECIKRATNAGHNIIYLMCDPLNRRIHKFYARLGFLPGILGNPSDPRGDMWLYYFGRGSFVRNFLEEHPFAEFRVSRGRVPFHGQLLYSMKWIDPISDDELEVFIRGQPGQPERGGTMPRIGGVRLKLDELSFDCWVIEGRSGEFELNMLNNGSNGLSVSLNPISRRGLRVSVHPPERTIRPGESVSIKGSLIVTGDFDVQLRYLTFPTVISSVILKFSRGIEAVVSVGFNLLEKH